MPAADESEPASGEAASDNKPGGGSAAESSAERLAKLRRQQRLDAIFGEVLPDTTADEREPGRRDDLDSWYRENRPPHHDR